MSIKSWKAEFYPVSAIKASGSWTEAAEHSLQKWIGLRDENLAKHDLLDKPDPIDMNSDTCALCRRDARHFCNDCNACPLYKVRGMVACVDITDEETESPFDTATGCGDVEPMIEWLKQTVEYAKRQDAEGT